MANSITMTEGQLGARLRADAAKSPKVVFRAMVSAAQRGKAFIVGKSPVDRGILRNAWKVVKLSTLNEVDLVNDQPYAGVVERGARPFKVSSEGIWALKAWVMRKLQSGQMFPTGAHTKITFAKGWNKAIRQAKGQSLITSTRRKRFTKPELEQQAESIAWAIAKTFEKVGIKGKRFVMQNLELLAGLMDAEVQRYLSDFFNRPISGGAK
jgi:hypothetical protein